MINREFMLKYNLSIPRYNKKPIPMINMKVPRSPKKCIGLLPNWFKNHKVSRSRKPLINLYNFNHESHFKTNSEDKIAVKSDYKILKDYCLKNRIINEDDYKMSRRIKRIVATFDLVS